MNNLQIDFNATIAIANPSPLTKEMLNNLPSNYAKTQSSGNFTLLYGTGFELENLKQELKQAEANNYLYSPDTQQGSFNVSGIGSYLIEFDIPFVTPPLNVSISGANTTDVFIESTSRFNMIINVQTDAQDILQYRASGFVGAASDKYLGDGLYNNFGALYQFPRVGESQIDKSYINFYSKVNKFINVQRIIPVQTFASKVVKDAFGNVITLPSIIINTPPINQFYVKGIIQPTKVVTSPEATNELIDLSGNLIALLNTSTTAQQASDFYINSGDNIYLKSPAGASVYILGPVSTFNFNAWDQPSYIQEVYRADNVYRRILSAINKSLYLGPTVKGVSNMIEALVAQPFIPHEIWNDSDFRIFKNSPGLTYSKFNNGTANSQYEGYPTIPPTVEVKRITQSWAPDTITYNNQPNIISMESRVTKTVDVLNNATQFNITNELTRSLRLGIDMPLGGIINWNYQNTITNIPTSGSLLYEKYNYVFLNNPGDSITNINLFWFAQQTTINGNPTGYKTFGPLQYGRDYFVIPTSNFLLLNQTYDLPSELLIGYNCNTLIPYVNGQKDIYNNYSWLGTNLTITPPSLPQFIIQIDLRNLSIFNSTISTKMPTNPFDFIIYSYGLITLTQGEINGSFKNIQEANGSNTIAAYYDADTSNAYQPVDSPYSTVVNNLPPTALAQTSFAKLDTSTGYEYITTMIGGQIIFNKTVLIDNIKRQTTVIGFSNISSPSILILQALNITLGSSPASSTGQIGVNNYILTGIVDTMVASIGPNIGKRYFQFNFGDYVLIDNNYNPIAVFDISSLINFHDLNLEIGHGSVTITGVVVYTIWDTRIPVANYITGSPVFQATANFNNTVIPFTPDINNSESDGIYWVNNNFLVRINGLPLGNQQTVTASWTFNILPTSATVITNSSTLGFSDTNISGSLQFGIMSLFTGLALSQINEDPDNAVYNQTYQSPSFSGYFLNYNDYINSNGGKISSFGDINAINTLTTPVISVPTGQPRLNTTLNFFSPNYGFISLSILPNMEFFRTNNGTPVNITRPNNNGIALQIIGNSYAGLTFYGSTLNKIVDKPTRLIANFTYAAANAKSRKKVVEIDDNGYANWTDGKYPDVVQNGSTFFIAGNQFKYPHEGYAQANNQYSDTYDTSGHILVHGNASGKILTSGQYYNRFPTNGSQPMFLTDPSLNYIPTKSDKLGEPGPPQRYRRPVTSNAIGRYKSPNILALTQGYYNETPEKIAFIQFDLSSFPIDTIVNNAILEIYFASGFTIKEAKNTNFELNHNIAWEKSRLSGNGKTYTQTLSDNQGHSYNINKSLQNVHWRKNFFEIIIPYAFNSEPNNNNYGIKNLFANTIAHKLPISQNSQPNLEYLGYINIDEIDISTLTSTNFIENSVGFANIILSTDSVVYLISGILSFYPNGTMENYLNTVSGTIYALNGTTIIGTFIQQKNILPNMKVLVFPFGTSTIANINVFFYGYTKSVLAATLIGFTPGDINIYKQILSYVNPLYAEYVVSLLESDTYFSYLTFSKESLVTDSILDIAY